MFIFDSAWRALFEAVESRLDSNIFLSHVLQKRYFEPNNKKLAVTLINSI